MSHHDEPSFCRKCYSTHYDGPGHKCQAHAPWMHTPLSIAMDQATQRMERSATLDPAVLPDTRALKTSGVPRCKTCHHFATQRPTTGVCKRYSDTNVFWPEVPADGSGFCHNHLEKA